MILFLIFDIFMNIYMSHMCIGHCGAVAVAVATTSTLVGTIEILINFTF